MVSLWRLHSETPGDVQTVRPAADAARRSAAVFARARGIFPGSRIPGPPRSGSRSFAHVPSRCLSRCHLRADRCHQLTGATIIPPAAGGSAPPAPAKPVKITAHTTQLHETFLPDLFAVNLSGITGGQLARIGKLRHVRGAIGLDGGAVRINGRLVNTIGADPARFRSWTPPQTADLAGIWAALDRGEFITTPAEAKTLGLRVGKRYQVSGARQPSVVFGGTATLGLLGVDAVVGTSLSRQLGLVRQFGALVSAPGANVTSLEAAVRGVLGRQAKVLSLTQAQDAEQERLPADGQATAGRPANYLELFRDSARLYCPGMAWTVLAAIGQIESGDGQNNGPSSAGALGPMQFMPSTR